MGMGGANIAVGGESNSMFHNPAGLSQLDPDEGFEIDLVNLGGTLSQNTLDLVDDLDAASTTAQTFNVLETYQGENNHLSLNNFSSVAYKDGDFSYSIGHLSSTQFNFQTHALGSPSGLLDVNGYILTGLVAGIAYDYSSELQVGFGFKSLQGKSMTAELTLTEVLDLTGNSSDSSQYFEDNFMSDFDSQTFDLGVTYNGEEILSFVSDWYPTLGLSIMDIGDTNLGSYGTIPMTVNLGLSLKPEFNIFNNWVFAIDYIDLLNELDKDYDADTSKKFRLGLKTDFIDTMALKFTGSLGMYNSSPTFGAELTLSIVRISFASYEEAIGAYADQNMDRRYTASLAIGW
jgi:hypothetical protein